MNPPSVNQLLFGTFIVVVAAVVGVGIVMLGPPSEERARRLDERRVEDLRRIASSARLYHLRHQRLPGSLAELSGEPGVTLVQSDPVTGAPYTYRVLDPATYEVCASFERASTDGRVASFWSHGAGRQCFTPTADNPVASPPPPHDTPRQ